MERLRGGMYVRVPFDREHEEDRIKSEVKNLYILNASEIWLLRK